MEISAIRSSFWVSRVVLLKSSWFKIKRKKMELFTQGEETSNLFWQLKVSFMGNRITLILALCEALRHSYYHLTDSRHLGCIWDHRGTITGRLPGQEKSLSVITVALGSKELWGESTHPARGFNPRLLEVQWGRTQRRAELDFCSVKRHWHY